MNTIVIILSVIATLVLLLFVLALVAPKSYSLKRQVIVDQPVHVVFNYLKHLKNQDYFNKWVMMDANLRKQFRGEDGKVGFVYAWQGNKQAGVGEQEIKRIEENKLVEVEVRFEKPMKGIARTPFSTEEVSQNQTRVTWEMSSTMKYPSNIILLFMNMDKLLGKDIQASLELLKLNLEPKN
ncbi:polyketide cyclase [Solitalea longa]|uniref:Polyketide cyclase n=1 Tax=Solitalea longa TaxID=2079460 RepID=A0A2S5A8R7_9SPHI|nr:SRPBCC family protein [Solitalea longa]POY38978.1 polyketide cyclase [Solitalea longa]